jgi:hypothetical protein
MSLLALIGRNASLVLLVGMVGVACFPGLSSVLRPYLPVMVSIVLGLGIARLNIGQVLAGFASPRMVLRLLAVVILFLPLTCFALSHLARLAGVPEDYILLLLVFAAAPPLSSAASLCLLLGYNARVALQVGVLGTLAVPVLGPICFAVSGVQADMALVPMAISFAQMIAGGFALGFALQWLVGADRIARNGQVFNGMVAIAMLVFLFPVFDGVIEHVQRAPLQSALLAVLAIALNIGGNLLTVRAMRLKLSPETASALGFIFGNRNVSFYLAVLPFNPLVSVFVAAAQIPIYGTPLLFLYLQRKAAR